MSPVPPIEISHPPKTKDVHMWADFVELLCLVNPDRACSRADVLDRYAEALDVDEELADIDAEEELTPLRPPQRNDKRALQANDWFTHLEYRQTVFRDFYPFYLSEQRDSVYRHTELTSKQKVYILFLLASNLTYFNQSDINILTSSFELVSMEALKSYLPLNAYVKLFGTGPLHHEAKYTGLLINKIRKLAADLGEQVLCNETHFRPGDTGDGGLDIVGWIPLGDSSGGFILIFAQCACTDNWETKQFSSSEMKWKKYITFSAPPCNMCFIPICFRSAGGTWHNSTKISDTILIDRVRLVHLLSNNENISEPTFAPYEFIENIISFQEPLV